MRGNHFGFGRQGRFNNTDLTENTFGTGARGVSGRPGRGEGPCGQGLGPGHGKRDGSGNGSGKGLGLGKRDGSGKGARQGKGRGPGGGGRGGCGGHGRGFGGGRGMGRGGRGPLGRLIGHGNLHLLILHLIAEQPRHGYEVIRVIEEMTHGAYVPSPGTVYPAFSMLEDQGFISPAETDGSKKRFAITDDGKAYLNENRAALESLLERIADTAPGAEPAAALRDAMDNFSAALEQRLSRGPLTEDETQNVAEALNAATGKLSANER